MRRLEMSWNTEGGRLVCRWSESKEREDLRNGWAPGFAVVRHFQRRAYSGDALGER